MANVAAIIVTRNRLALLEQCLAALDAQTTAAQIVIVVDNASEQDTRDFLHAESVRRGAKFLTVLLPDNQGPAGGFHEGLRAALPTECSHMWLMDDDCAPVPEALAELLAATDVVGADAVLGGNVFDRDGESINVQPVSKRAGANGVSQFPHYLAQGVIELEAISFASFFIPAALVRKAGLPMKELFLWGDDHEYSLRLARHARLYQVGKSKMIHYKSGDAGLRIARERDPARLAQYKMLYRNQIYITKTYYGALSAEMGKFAYRCVKDIVASVRSGDNIAAKCRTIAVGIFEGIGLTLWLKAPTDAGETTA